MLQSACAEWRTLKKTKKIKLKFSNIWVKNVSVFGASFGYKFIFYKFCGKKDIHLLNKSFFVIFRMAQDQCLIWV